MYCLGTPERGNRWGRAPVVGPTGHSNRQIAHLHLRLGTGDITSRCFISSNTDRFIQHKTGAADIHSCQRMDVQVYEFNADVK